MSDKIVPVSPQIAYVATMLRSRTRQPTRHMPPAEQVLHILGQHDMFWSGILTPKTLHALSVVLEKERRLISAYR